MHFFFHFSALKRTLLEPKIFLTNNYYVFLRMVNNVVKLFISIIISPSNHHHYIISITLSPLYYLHYIISIILFPLYYLHDIISMILSHHISYTHSQSTPIDQLIIDTQAEQTRTCSILVLMF